MTTTVTSKKFTIDLPDVWKGLIVATLSPVFVIMIGVFSTGSFSLDWRLIGTTAAAAFLGYIMKNFFSPSSVKVENVSNETADAVKQGTAEVKVLTK